MELNLYGEGGALRFGLRELKFASILLYGEDIRDKLSLTRSYACAVSVFSRIRGNPDFLVFPLTYPDPEGEFYGYDKRKARAADGTLHPGIKELVNCV